jgi:hypothetical protein
MPAMSRIERIFCQSAIWRPAATAVVGWSSSDQQRGGDVLEIGSDSDGSPLRLITIDELREGFAIAGLVRVTVSPAILGQGMRFVAQR